MRLTTTGRKSGQPRSVMLTSPVQEGDNLVIVASKGGEPEHPAWYLNMQANPRVRVQLGREHFDAVAVEVQDEEREALWQEIVEINHHQGEYLAETSRRIPLVWLRPRATPTRWAEDDRMTQSAPHVAFLMGNLHTGGVEVQRARGSFEAGGRTWKAGTHVVSMQQPAVDVDEQIAVALVKLLQHVDFPFSPFDKGEIFRTS